jgi:hypothetical protein
VVGAACGQSRSSSAATGGPTPTSSHSTGNLTAWSFGNEPLEPATTSTTGPVPNDAAASGQPSGTEIDPAPDQTKEGPQQSFDKAQSAPGAAQAFGGSPFDPCSLVTAAEWQSVAGSAKGPYSLEYGDACGYTDAADRKRLAVGFFPASSGPGGSGRWLTQADRERATKVSGLSASPAYWLAGYPVVEGSSLVIELPQGDLVIEIYAFEASDRAALQGPAETLARAALSRVPAR